MNTERGRLSTSCLLLSVFCFMHVTVLRSSFVVGFTKNDTWAMPFTGLLLVLPLIAIYVTLLRRFPGKNLMEINDAIFGSILGKVVSVLYLFFLISLAALNTRDLGNFVIGNMMPTTPGTAITLIFLFGCTYALRKGIVGLLHLSTIFAFINVAALTFNTILILKDAHFTFLKPFFQLDFIKYVQGSVSIATIPMGEILAFLMITPMLPKNKGAGKPFLYGLILTAISMAVVLTRDIIALGPLVSIVSVPSYESVSYVSLAEILTRLESIYAIMLLLLFTFKVCILLYASALGLAHVLGMNGRPANDAEAKPTQLQIGEERLPLVLITAALVYLYSQFVFESVMENLYWGATVAPFFALTFELLLPAICLLVALLRKKSLPQEVKA